MLLPGIRLAMGSDKLAERGQGCIHGDMRNMGEQRWRDGR